MINPRIRGSEEGVLPIVNDFRQIAIISDPYIYSTSNVASNTAFSQTTDITLSGVSADFEQDEIVYQGASLNSSTFSGRVVEWDSTNTVIKLINTKGTVVAETIIGENSSTTGFVASESTPDLVKNSGKILYVDNISPISRNENQTESFQLILKF